MFENRNQEPAEQNPRRNLAGRRQVACSSVTNVHTRLTSCSTQYSRLDPNLLPVVALPPHQPAPATRMRPVTTAPRLQHAHEAAASLRLPDHHKQEDDRDGHDDRAHAADPHSAAVGLLRSAAEPAAARATHPDHHRLVRGPATAWKTDRGEGAAGERGQQGERDGSRGERDGSRGVWGCWRMHPPFSVSDRPSVAAPVSRR